MALAIAPPISQSGQAVSQAAKAGKCQHVTAKGARSFVDRAWNPKRWRRPGGKPGPAIVRAYKRKLRCAAGPGHRSAIANHWGRDRLRYGKHRRRELARASINYRWPGAFYPSVAWERLPQLPPYVIAALAEKAGDAFGVDVPGWTMAQMTIGESGRRPGSAGVDLGGTRGYGLWAITTRYNDDLVAPYGGYEEMWNPVKNAAVMAHIYARQGLGAWYGDGHVTSTNAHYRGRFDLRLVLDGLTFRQALGL